MKTELGGDRLGSGNKQEISLKNYKRSTHDLGYIWRSSMSSGTLVPFMSELALPGDSFDIDLDCDVKTLPTVGPLFGSYKVQLDVFECPIRLYQGKLHMNMLNIGLDMSEVLLPQINVKTYDDKVTETDNAQINSSSILSYLNIRGCGLKAGNSPGNVARDFNAVPFLGYWDVYKNYYANKQEERGFVIHNANLDVDFDTAQCNVLVIGDSSTTSDNVFAASTSINTDPDGDGLARVEMQIVFKWNNSTGTAYGTPKVNEFEIVVGGTTFNPYELFETVNIPEIPASGMVDNQLLVICGNYTGPRSTNDWDATLSTQVDNEDESGIGQPELTEFDLTNIDDMRMDILEAVRSATAFKIDDSSSSPYGLVLDYQGNREDGKYYARSNQEGLGIKTYQSDLFNNWISTEWIDGTNGINEVTAVSTSGDEFTIDALNLANKVYNMLNRIAISGGSYDDWLDAVYTHERSKSCESPIYHGSLIKELAFEEVVSTTDVLDIETSTDQPMGTLAGRGRLTNKNKGGKVKIKVSEPSYILGIVSLTPRIDYSQGNKWDVNLKSMNDLHKPALDEIGFQDLTTDQMAWFDTDCNQAGDVTYKSAGKQPAWINYMTNVNVCRGNFAVPVGAAGGQGEMFMTLNRRYEFENGGIGDLTTYVDPSKFNQIFAQTQLDSQNFWVQISNKIIARRKMSAKVIPNL